MKYNYTQAGGNPDTFDEQTLGDVLDFILTFIEMNSKKKNPNQKQQDNRVKGQTETFGVSPETLARWKAEEEANGE